MKDYNRLTGMSPILALLLALLLAVPAFVLAEIYKTTDEEGNVIYTDQKPEPDSQPLELRELSVISPQVRVVAPKEAIRPSQRQSVDGEQQEVTSIRDLRRGYRDFAIVSPLHEQSFLGTGNEATIAWNTQYRLQEGMTVTVYIDGKAQPPTMDSSIKVEKLWRGAHEVYAVLKDDRNRQIATTDPITFFIKQHSVNFPVRQSQGG